MNHDDSVYWWPIPHQYIDDVMFYNWGDARDPVEFLVASDTEDVNQNQLQRDPEQVEPMNKLIIEKVTGGKRKKGSPDYRISIGNQLVVWVMDVYPNNLIERDSRFTSYELKHNHNINPDIENLIKPIYNILESKGSPSMSLVYKEFLDHEHFRYRLANFPDLTIHGMISYLVHFTIWEPEKIEWTGYT